MSAAPIYESVDAAARLMALDSDADSLDNLNPIFGLDEVPDLSFEDAVKCAQVRKKEGSTVIPWIAAIDADESITQQQCPYLQQYTCLGPCTDALPQPITHCIVCEIAHTVWNEMRNNRYLQSRI